MAYSITGLTATLTSYAIGLAWSIDETFDSIRVFRSKDGGSLVEISTLAGDAVSYSDSPDHGSSYIYELYGYKSPDIGEYSASNAVIVPPAPPLNPTASLSGYSVNLSWVNGEAYNSINIYRKRVGEGYSFLKSVAGTATSTSNSYVSPSASYFYLIEGVLGVGTSSAESNQVDIPAGGACGGGGGSSAGTGADGGTGSEGSAFSGGAGGTPPSGGGSGGGGGDSGDNGDAGYGPGGGGGGAGRASSGDRSGGDGADGKVAISYTPTTPTASDITDTDIGSITAGTRYKLSLKHKLVSGVGTFTVSVYVGTERQGISGPLSSATWAAAALYFDALNTGAAKMIISISATGASAEFRFDQASLKTCPSLGILPRYPLPAGCTGVYMVTLNGLPIWYGQSPDGWYYDAAPINELYFDPQASVVAGTDNLVVYYFTAQIPLYVLADLLAAVGLYETRAAALADMIYESPGPSLDRVWFDAGTAALNAVKMLAERCNFRFYFDFSGAPVFAVAPSIKIAGEEDCSLEQNQISVTEIYEDTSELFNSVSVEGEAIAQPVGPSQTMPSNYKGSDSDAASIALYGEKAKSIQNHLFQSDAACAAMAVELVAAFKDAKIYFTFSSAFLMVPLELGDTIRAQVRLSSVSGGSSLFGKFFWGDGTKWGSNGLVLIHRGKVRDIKIDNFGTTYICELAQ